MHAVFPSTPYFDSEPSCRTLGCRVGLKRETANPVRSFKGRGAEVVAARLVGQGRTALVCAGAGNLGQALAWSGCRRRPAVSVVASAQAQPAKLDRIRALGAELVLVDESATTRRRSRSTSGPR